MKLKAVILATGMLLGTSVLANDADIHLAALNNGVLSMAEQSNEDPDEEIGSTDTTEFDNHIGAFSREDGAMLGAYGDGEFAD